MAIPLSWWLTVSAALFSIGIYGALTRKNAIAILMGVELMLNAVNINLVAFWRHVAANDVAGQIFAIVVAVAAAEAAVWRCYRCLSSPPFCRGGRIDILKISN
jgi:NADH-quinone oxidoreductase subunit K